MARLWWESFEGEHDLKWSDGLDGDIVAASPEIGDGSRVLRMDQNRQRNNLFPFSLTESYMGFWFRTGLINGSLTQFANYRDGQPEFFFSWLKGTSIRLISFAISNTTRKMTLYNFENWGSKIAEGTYLYSDLTQYHLEIRYKIHGSNGSIQVWRDGILDLDYDGVNTDPGSYLNYNCVQIYSPNSGGFPAYFDSFMLNDLVDPGGTSAGKDIGRIGVKHLWGQLPDMDSTVNNAWSRSTGTDGWALVDERPPDGTTTYVYATTNGLKQGFLFQPHGLPVNATVDAVIHEHVMVKVTDGQTRIGMRSNGVEHLNPIEALSTSYDVHEIRLTEDPDGDVDWTRIRADQIESLAESVF